MQAQAPNLPYVGLWSRLQGFRPEEVSGLVERRRAVRTSLMRNTIHLVTTRDALRLKPLFQPVHERGLFHGSPWGRGMDPAAVEPLLSASREIMTERPRSVAELGRLLAPRFPGRDPATMAYVVRYLLPTVFVPPRGIWGAGGQVRLTTVEAWLGRPAGPAIPLEELALRYLAAFGPATPGDMRAWSRLASVRDAFERLRPRLVTFRDERGREFFDLPRAPRPRPDTEAPVRLLPDYDNALLAHADRTRIMAPGMHLGLFSSNGVMKGSVLLDGFVRAGWAPVQARGSTTLLVTPFAEPIPARAREQVTASGLELLALPAWSTGSATGRCGIRARRLARARRRPGRLGSAKTSPRRRHATARTQRASRAACDCRACRPGGLGSARPPPPARRGLRARPAPRTAPTAAGP
jgi:hypothetical protein